MNQYKCSIFELVIGSMFVIFTGFALGLMRIVSIIDFIIRFIIAKAIGKSEE